MYIDPVYILLSPFGEVAAGESILSAPTRLGGRYLILASMIHLQK